MEKVVIKSAAKKEYNGKTFVTIQLEDGRMGSSNDLSLESMVGQIVELEVKLAKEYNGVQQYYFNLPKQPKQAAGRFAKDTTFEKRRVALECAVEYAKNSTRITSVEVRAIADKFYEWLDQ